MIDHTSIEVADLDKSTYFYEKVFEPLGLVKLVSREMSVGFGKKYPEFWINHRPDKVKTKVGTGSHICLRAPSQEAINQFHKIAVSLGGKSDGAPGNREASMTSYYAAFIFDLDGNKVEAAWFDNTSSL